MVGGVLPASRADWLAVTVLCIALALGGATGQGFWSDAIVQLLSLALILAVVVQITYSGRAAAIAAPIAFATIIATIPSLQLIPLPPAIWSALSGRAAILQGFVQAGIDPPWLPLSLSPETTLRSCLSLVPPIAIFLSAALLGSRARRWMALAVLIFAGLSVALGMAQVSGGPSSPLRFYATTNVSKAVGFFANRNHYSALLYSAVSLLGAWTIWITRRRGERFLLSLVVCLAFYAIFIFASVSAASRAGLALAVLAALGLAAMALPNLDLKNIPQLNRFEDNSRLLRKALITSGGAVILVGLIGLSIVGLFVGRSALNDPRLDIFRTAWTAAMSYAPVGAGFGTFAFVYQMFEVPERITTELINRAHNDWLEAWLEGGGLSLAVAAAFFAWFVARSTCVWRATAQENSDFDLILARASSIVVLLLALHSFVDYPLRTTAMACVFALACGSLMGWRKPEKLDGAVGASRLAADRNPLALTDAESMASLG